MAGKQVPFDYSVETTPALAASERRTLTIRTQADSYFVVTALVGLSTLAGGAAGDCNVLIGDDTIGAIWCSRLLCKEQRSSCRQPPQPTWI